MTTNSVSKEILALTAANEYWPTAEQQVSMARELLSLRTSSGGVTSGEVVSDEMVERAARAMWKASVPPSQENDFPEHPCIARSLYMKSAYAAITAALSSLNAQPEGELNTSRLREEVEMSRTTLLRYCLEAQAGRYPSDAREFERRADAAFRSIIAILDTPEPQGTGSREAQCPAAMLDGAWMYTCELDDRTSPEEYPNHALLTREELGFAIEEGMRYSGLVPLAQLQAVERERDALTSRNAVLAADGIAARKAAANNFARAETAEASLAAALAGSNGE